MWDLGKLMEDGYTHTLCFREGGPLWRGSGPNPARVLQAQPKGQAWRGQEGVELLLRVRRGSWP